MPLLHISLAIAAILNISLGIYALVSGPRRLATYAFSLLAIGMGAWVGTFALLLVTQSFFFDKPNHFSSLLVISSLFLLAQTFSEKNTWRASWILLYLPILFAAIVIVPAGLVVKSISFTSGGTVIPTQGAIFPYYAAGLLLYFFASLFLFVRTYAMAQRSERLRMKYFFLGIGIFVVAVSAGDIVLPALGFPYLNAIGPVASVIFIGLTGYAIVRHELLDIKVVIQRGLVYSVLLSLITLAYLATLAIIARILGTDSAATAPVSAAIVTIIGIFTVPTIERVFQKATDRFFFKDKYEYSDALHHLSDILGSELTPNDLMMRGLNAVKDILHLDRIEFLHLRSAMVITPAGVTPAETIAAPTAEIPVMLQNKTLGTLRLGHKRSGDPLSPEDMSLVRTFANQAAVALQRAEFYQELKNHAALLEEKVRERTIHLEAIRQNQKVVFEEISHALETPLTVLKEAVGILTKNGGVAGEESQIHAIERSAENLSSVIYELLKLSKIDKIPADNAHANVDLSRLLAGVIEYAEIICREHDITLTHDIEKDVQMIGDEQRLEELVKNLLTNAVRYTRTSPVRSVKVSLRRGTDTVVLEVRDTGLGIRAVDLSHIFERFYRSEAVKDTSGIGLGLSICKKIAEQHGGTIEAASTEGKGATFTVRFPRGEHILGA